MKQKIAVMLIMIMTATIMFSSFAYAEADNNVGIKIEFDKTAYVKGETATATLTLTGLSGAKQEGLKIGAFETHLKFNPNKLTYKSGEFDASLFGGIADAELTKVFQMTTDHKDIIVIAFEDNKSGISLDNVDANGNLKIGTVTFDIVANTGDNIAIGFDETSYITELANKDIERIAITVPQEDSTADIKNVIAENASAKFETNKIIGSIDVGLSTGQKAVLIAQLYDTSSGLTKGTVVKPNLSGVNSINDITFGGVADKTNLVVKYYLWESFANMKALTTIQPIEVQ